MRHRHADRAFGARYADAPPKGEIVVIVGPPGEAAAEEADDDDTRCSAAAKRWPTNRVAQAAKAVAKRFGLDRHEVYARALTLKEQA